MSVIKKYYLEQILLKEDDFDFYDEDEPRPIPPEPEPPGGISVDFGDIDTDPPVVGPDDGVYNFGDIDEGDETAEGDYDYGDAEEDEDFIYDYNDIDENPDVGNIHSQFDIELNFGDSDTYGYQVTKEWLLKAVKDSVEEMKQDNSYVVTEVDMEQGMEPYVMFQYFYNERTNKSFIQFNMYNHNKGYEWDKSQLVERITRKIKNQFKYDTGIWPEIMNRSNLRTVCDNRINLGPYAIGYWKSLDDVYEILEDKAEITLDARKFTSDPPKIIDGHIIPPDKTMEQFFDIVRRISDDYDLRSTEISHDNRNDYITQYYQILKETHGQGDYDERIAALNESFIPERYKNDNIPNAMEEFVDEYEDFFEYRLPKVVDFARRAYVKIEKLAS